MDTVPLATTSSGPSTRIQKGLHSKIPQDVTHILSSMDPPAPLVLDIKGKGKAIMEDEKPPREEDEEISEEAIVLDEVLNPDGVLYTPQSMDIPLPDVAGPSTSSKPASNPADNDDSDSDSDSSDTDSDSSASETSEILIPDPKEGAADEDEDDAEAAPAATNPNYFASVHEIVHPEVKLPAVAEVGRNEVLDEVGEIMNVISDVVVVVGNQPGDDRVLDEGTLLVFDDRKVLGHIFETFGPVNRPMYSIRFPSVSSIDPTIHYPQRKVFHVPRHSSYVFTKEIKHLKGSDASNVYDEEVDADEAEFSDDEQEANAKTLRRQNARAPVIRHAEAPPPKAHISPDLQYGDSEIPPIAGPSRQSADQRPAPKPYEEASVATPNFNLRDDKYAGLLSQTPVLPNYGESSGSARGRGGARGGHQGGAGRGGGRGRGAPGGINKRGRGGRVGLGISYGRDEYDPKAPSGIPRPLSPTSAAIARVTGQHADGRPANESTTGGHWNPNFFPQAAQGYVPVPHINPLFALGFAQQHMQMQVPGVDYYGNYPDPYAYGGGQQWGDATGNYNGFAGGVVGYGANNGVVEGGEVTNGFVGYQEGAGQGAGGGGT